MIAKRIKVIGKVQGVFYRASAKQKANELSLGGWVKNEPDGTVLIEVCGEVQAIEEFENWCKKGPMMAQVEKVETQDIPIEKFSSFEIIS